MRKTSCKTCDARESAPVTAGAKTAPQIGVRVSFSRFRSVIARVTVFSPKLEWRETTHSLSGLRWGGVLAKRPPLSDWAVRHTLTAGVENAFNHLVRGRAIMVCETDHQSSDA